MGWPQSKKFKSREPRLQRALVRICRQNDLLQDRKQRIAELEDENEALKVLLSTKEGD